jgi:hypothetical protein
MTVDFSVVHDAAGEAQAELRIGYAGRGGRRGGESALAIVFDSLPYLIEFVVQMMQAGVDAEEWIGNVHTDSMGHNSIAYWPHVTVENVPDEDDEDDDEDDEVDDA